MLFAVSNMCKINARSAVIESDTGGALAARLPHASNRNMGRGRDLLLPPELQGVPDKVLQVRLA
jgi:hypothetical protein